MIKKLVRFLLIIVLILLAIGTALYFIVDQPLPNGTFGLEAEELADEMLEALNKEGFDSLEYIAFTYRGEHHYQWDRKNNQVTVKWESQEISLDLNQGMDSFNLLELKAYKYFINDSFWLIAPFKVRDKGVIRSTVEVDDGRGLLITYSTGGLTPGDSYLWIMDERGFPVAWRLWTSNIPIGGLKLSWEGWTEMNGVWFSTVHKGKLAEVPVTNLSVR